MGFSDPNGKNPAEATGDRTGFEPATPIHPRLRPAAEAKIERLQARLHVLCGEAAQRLQAAIRQLRAFALAGEVPGGTAVLGELERALADIEHLAVSEFADAAGLAALKRRLTLANENIRTLRRDKGESGPPGPDFDSRLDRNDGGYG